MKATNLGQTGLKLKWRAEDPMRIYDALPAPLRLWLSDAAMPWSPASCRKIWQQAKARGECLDQVLARLDRAEQKTLARKRSAGLPGLAQHNSGEICVEVPSKSTLK